MTPAGSVSASPSEALGVLAESLRGEDTVVSQEVIEPVGTAALGSLVAVGPRSADAPFEYALVVESVREGYLLHYGTPRVLDPDLDPDLALLAGDYLFARGLERLAALGDVEAVAELSDLISLSAQLHAHGGAEAELAGPLWISSVLTLAHGASGEHDAAKQALAGEAGEAAELLDAAITACSEGNSFGELLDEARKSVGFRSENRG